MSPSPVPSPSVNAAAAWLSGLSASPSPIVPALRTRFSLSAPDACEAIRIATELRSERWASERLRQHVAPMVGFLEAAGATILNLKTDGPSVVLEYRPDGADEDVVLRQVLTLRSDAARLARGRMAEEIPVELDEEARRLRDLG